MHQGWRHRTCIKADRVETSSLTRSALSKPPTTLICSIATMSAIPTEQKALFLESKFGQFAVRTTEVPKPAADAVLVKVEATALNPLDWKVQAHGLRQSSASTRLGPLCL